MVEGPGDIAEIELRLDLSACAKSKEFLRKTKDFRGQWDGGPDDVAEVGLRLDLSMGCKK